MVRDRVQRAADAFEQAARVPGARSLGGRARAGWRASDRALQDAPRAARGGGAVVVLTLLIALVEAVEAAAAWHRAGVPGAGESRRQGGRAPARGRRPCGYPAPLPPTTKSRTGVSDVVRRATHKRLTGREVELGEDADAMAPGWSADQLRGHLGDDVLAALKQGADWPQMARQLVGLLQVGVDLGVSCRRWAG
ncbi:hypothetical protein [Streptomyces sp. NPDC088748]|uniref:hypothetical protein n=1 Tax=Streptomyces sp. NPDC088748 TaxID=3365887 RepID=UPI003801679F